MYGRKKTAIATSFYKTGKGQFKVDGIPLDVVEPEMLRAKAKEPPTSLGLRAEDSLLKMIQFSGLPHM